LVGKAGEEIRQGIWVVSVESTRTEGGREMMEGLCSKAGIYSS
jgi:hypothetical protein